MRILVTSDTHISNQPTDLPSQIQEEAKKSDLCLHCGDFTSYQVYEDLNSLTKTYGVCGNMDTAEIRNKLPQKQILNFQGINIGLIHGGGNPANLINFIKDEFIDDYDKIDIFVYGHSHKPQDEEIEGKIFFNPGSSTDTIYSPYCSYGILEINNGDLKRRVVKIG